MGKTVRYNKSSPIKEYFQISDFSGGIDNKHADSDIQDNKGRIISNFNIESGGILSKRQGIHAIQGLDTTIIEAFKRINLNITKEEISNLDIIKSYDLSYKEQKMIVLFFMFKEQGTQKEYPYLLTLIFDNDFHIPTISAFPLAQALVFEKKEFLENNQIEGTLKKIENLTDIPTYFNLTIPPKINSLADKEFCIWNIQYNSTQKNKNDPKKEIIGTYNINITCFYDFSIFNWDNYPKPISGSWSDEIHFSQSINGVKQKVNPKNDVIDLFKAAEYYVISLNPIKYRDRIKIVDKFYVWSKRTLNLYSDKTLNNVLQYNSIFEITKFNPLEEEPNYWMYLEGDVYYNNAFWQKFFFEDWYSSQKIQFKKGEINNVNLTDEEKIQFIKDFFKPLFLPTPPLGSTGWWEGKWTYINGQNVVPFNIYEEWFQTNNTSFFCYGFTQKNDKDETAILNFDWNIKKFAITTTSKAFPFVSYKISLHDLDTSQDIYFFIRSTQQFTGGSASYFYNMLLCPEILNFNTDSPLINLSDQDWLNLFNGTYQNDNPTIPEVYVAVNTFNVLDNRTLFDGWYDKLPNDPEFYKYPLYPLVSLFGPQKTQDRYTQANLNFIADSCKNYGNGSNQSYVWEYFLRGYFKTLININDKLIPKIPSSYLPDPTTMTNFGYNLISLENVLDIENITIDKVKTLINFNETNTGQTSTFYTPILINSILPFVNENLKYLTRYIDPINKIQTYIYRYKLITLEEWTRQQGAYTNDAEYVKNFIQSATKINNDTPISTFIEIPLNLSNRNQYKLLVFATTKPTWSDITKSTDFFEVQTDINPNSSEAVSVDIPNVINNFGKTINSLTFKNQKIIYGGSNCAYFSEVNNFSYFPLNNFIEIPVSQEIISIIPFYNSLLIQTKDKQFLFKGDTPQNATLLSLNGSIGSISSKSVKPFKNYIFSMTQDGIYATISQYNNNDRLNVRKIDKSLATIPIDENSCATDYRNKYYIHTPSTKALWIYNDDYQSWTKHEGSLYDFENIYTIKNRLVFIGKKGINIYPYEDKQWIAGKESLNDVNDIFIDKDAYGNNENVVSIYQTKNLDFNFPNHQKRFKRLDLGFQDNVNKSDIIITLWVDQQKVIDPNKRVDFTYNPTYQDVPNITTENTTIFDKGQFDIGAWDGYSSQLTSILIHGKGQTLAFKLEHKENTNVIIRTFGIIFKPKKPKSNKPLNKN